MSVIDKLDQLNSKPTKPVTPVRSPFGTPSYTPLSIQQLSTPKPVQTAADRLAIIENDRNRGVSISQGTEDPVQRIRQSMSGIPIIGQFLTGTGPQGPSNSLYEPGSIPQSLVEKGIIGFMLEGFQKKVSPTRAEVGEQIFTRYEALKDAVPDEKRRLELAVQDVFDNSLTKTSGKYSLPNTESNLSRLKEPGVKLSEVEKDALFWTNLLEETFAVLDAPIFVGSTKIPKNALLTFLKSTDDVTEIVPRLRMIGVAQDVAEKAAPRIAKSTNEIEIARIIRDVQAGSKVPVESKTPSIFSKAVDKVTTKITPGRVPTEVKVADKIDEAAPVIKRADEVDETGVERFFRATNDTKAFEEVKAADTVPAFIREDMDTFVVKSGDEFQVVEGRTGQQLGDGGRTVAEAVQKAKSEVESMGEERLQQFISNSPLSPRYTKMEPKIQEPAKSTGNSTDFKMPEGVITADKLKLTDKAAARRLAKLERMAGTSPDIDQFIERTGITKPALDKTVQKQGYKDTEQFFSTNKPRMASKSEERARGADTPDERVMPDDEGYYSLLAEQKAGDSFAISAKQEEADQIVENLQSIFADMKGIEVDKVLRFTEEDLDQAKMRYEFMLDSLLDDPARALAKYANRNGELPEVVGSNAQGGNRYRINGKWIVKKPSFFGRNGDDIAKSLGFSSSEEAREAYQQYLKRKEALKEVYEETRRIANSVRMAKQMNNFVEVNQKALAKELQQNQKALANLVKAAERAGFRKGASEGNKKMEAMVQKLRSRRQSIGSIKWRYNLSSTEMQKAMAYAHKEMRELDIPDDPRFMTNDEFTEYVARLESAADDFEKRRIERGIVKAIIEQKELKNTENLREVMNLPTLSEMTVEQMQRYEKVLEKFQDGDEFLSKRTLEVIDRTALKGARTIRQTQEFLAQEIKRTLGKDINPNDLQNLTAGASDYLRWDTALAESKPFYGFMVNRAQKHIMDGEMNFVRIQERIFDLAEKAKKSRVAANKNKIQALKRELATTTDPDVRKTLKGRMKSLGWRANVKQKLVPTYSRIIRYLEARGEEKEMFWKTLTKEEQQYASFIRNYYNSAYNYLSYINELHGSRYIDAYFTHIRKGFLEKWTDDGFVAAVKNMWDAQKEDMAIANIIDSDTGRILPKSKFFQFVIQRTGEGETSQNLTRVFLQYAKLLERKKMLDKMVPELDIYTNSLTPKELTQRGLEMDRTLKEFVNNYLNNKRGRRFNYGGIVKQNGPIDIALRAGNTFVSFMDLGLNFLAGSASMVGEQVSNFVALGNRGTLRGFKRRIWDTGMKRMVDPNAAKILKEAEAFTGRNIWTEIAEVDKPIFEKGMQMMFGLFSQSSVEASKIYLLGSITQEELKAGKISAQRLADMRLEAGRWRDMGSTVKSIVGATSPGAAWTKYKGWAIPIMRTASTDMMALAKTLKKGEFKEALTMKETKELMRTLEVTTVALILGSALTSGSDDNSPFAKLRDRLKQESLTILGGIDPTVFLATPRLYSWMQQFATNLKKIVMLEEYQTDGVYGDKGDLKGVGGLMQQLTPGFIKQFLPKPGGKKSTTEEVTGSSSGSGGLDSLDRLDKLDSLDKVDSLDRLDRLDKLDSL